MAKAFQMFNLCVYMYSKKDMVSADQVVHRGSWELGSETTELGESGHCSGCHLWKLRIGKWNYVWSLLLLEMFCGMVWLQKDYDVSNGSHMRNLWPQKAKLRWPKIR